MGTLSHSPSSFHAGIAKGIRRIVAFTGDEARKAIAEGNRLAAEIEAAKAMKDSEMDKAVGLIKQVRATINSCPMLPG